jgi:type VI secretion system secreted protein Hcp
MKIITKVLLILSICCFVTAANGASLEVFLKIDGIEGDSTDQAHVNEINAVSFNIGVLNPVSSPTGGGGTVGKAQFTDLTVLKFIDKASPQLFLASAQGDRIRSATLVVRKSGSPFAFLKIVLDDVLISGVNDNASSTDQDGNLLEQITLNWRRITLTFIPQNPDGSRGAAITRFFDRARVNGG